MNTLDKATVLERIGAKLALNRIDLSAIPNPVWDVYIQKLEAYNAGVWVEIGWYHFIKNALLEVGATPEVADILAWFRRDAVGEDLS